jgi:hypothetical protein
MKIKQALLMRCLGAVTDRLPDDHRTKPVLTGINGRRSHTPACGAAR